MSASLLDVAARLEKVEHRVAVAEKIATVAVHELVELLVRLEKEKKLSPMSIWEVLEGVSGRLRRGKNDIPTDTLNPIIML